MLSSTSRFVGELDQPDLLLTHAFPNLGDRLGFTRMTEGPLSRSAFVACFETPPIVKAPGVVLPDYSAVGDVLASMLSVLYGKRFDNHGLTESLGRYVLPDTTLFSSTCNVALPHNSHAERANFPVELNLMEGSRIVSFFRLRAQDQRFATAFEGACSFYARALRNCESDPEVAYLHLITAGEILSAYFSRDQDTLLDDSVKAALEEIGKQQPNGPKLVKLIRGRLLQIKRRFVRAFTDLVDADFFCKSEAVQPFFALSAADFEHRVAAAYDLRSKFVHTGINFGKWIEPRGDQRAEIQLGTPVVPDKEFAKILTIAPTFVGLERVVRYALLRFAMKFGCELFPELSPA
ncbi:Uncharacterised protein [Burkholderia pseudomallei]|nr:Uncharacterised protein [Burkholderia pseudomallei]CAJ7297129.1 Uncharacterised protein [Burkholderia pseudomallei]